MFQLGLIGKSLSHSFSKNYFSEKFTREHIPAQYSLFELPSIAEFPQLLADTPALIGLNVTIPYKEQVIPFLSKLDASAQEVGAVNTIVLHEGQRIGYNTDVAGAIHSLRLMHMPPVPPALILGTGGAAKAVAVALRRMGCTDIMFASRTPRNGYEISYDALSAQFLATRKLVINTTPMGMYPDVQASPELPYEALTPQHYCWDVVYNPLETLFLHKAKQQGAHILNGLPMLHEQAEAAWEYWKPLVIS